jgi:hypothetical protein
MLAIAMNLAPIFGTNFFPTLDGPAHLYNANLIKEFWFGNSIFLEKYFSQNSNLVPNWTGHFILVFFKTFLTAAKAEKGLLLIYFISLPLAFRSLIKVVSPSNLGMSYFIFPFLYSSVFAMGFYNFSLALPLLLFTLSFWIKSENKLSSKRNIVVLFILFIATYFSHLFVFVLLLLLIGLKISQQVIFGLLKKGKNNKLVMHEGLTKAGWLMISAIVPIVLLAFYFVNRVPSGNNEYLSYQDLWNAILNLDALIAYDRNVEQAFTRKIFYIFLGMLLLALGQWVYNALIKKKKSKIESSTFWGIATISVLALYFIMPDSDETAGYVSSRLGLIFFLIFAVWLGTQNINKFVIAFSVVCILFFNYKLINYHRSQTLILNDIAVECYQASQLVQANKVVLPIDNTNHWLLTHFSNYLGVEKPLVILENYEAYTGYFPINWNETQFPNIFLGKKASLDFPCLYWKSNEKGKKKQADYIFVLGNSENKEDDCVKDLSTAIHASYKLINTTNFTKLYQLK